MSNRITPLLPLIGWLMLGAVLLSVAHGLGLIAAYWAGGCAWLAGVLLFSRVRGLLRVQVVLISTIGVLALWWGSLDQPLPWARLLAVNHSLIAMLIAVSFLRLVTSIKADPEEQLPLGRRALWRTLLGVHLFGAVINMSTLMIIGERLTRYRQLTPLQGMLLSRGFASASHWSPFFVAMGVALIHADGAQLSVVSTAGVPAAVLALLLAGISLSRQPGARQFAGYPMHFDALWLPGLLAVLVIAARMLWPDISILTWVSLLSLLLCLSVIVIRQGSTGLLTIRQHIERQLPQMGGEISLFLAAGVLSVGLALVVQRTGFEIQLDHFGPWQAWSLLLVIVTAAVIGIHPLISISTSASVLAGQVGDPNLLALTYLMGWALGIMASPVSGTHLTLQARFGLPAYRFFRWNLGFVVQLLLADLLVLHGYNLLVHSSG
ncbi:MAG: hypothetical protein V7707_13630 [Motiliproteus sp.]